MSRYYKDDYDWEDYIADTENGRIDFDIDTVIDLLNQQDEKIKELEEENGYIMFEDGYDENGKEINKQTYITYKQAFTDAVLEAKRLRKENKKLKSQLEEQKNINKKLDLENQKLFEENINQSYDVKKCVKVAKEQIDKTFNAECELSIVKTNQKQLAIEELEKVKEYASETIIPYECNYCIYDYLDNRISELRGEK